MKPILSPLIALLIFCLSPVEAESNKLQFTLPQPQEREILQFTFPQRQESKAFPQPQERKESELGRLEILFSSPASRDYMEVGIEFARCDALLFSIYNGVDTKGFETDRQHLDLDMVGQIFATSYPDQVEWLDFYDGLIGFDRQYEMWFEYGDDYDFLGPNHEILLGIFFFGWMMTEELKRAVSDQVPQAHFDLFLSRREEAFRSALMKSGARHAEVHSKMLECIDLARFWGIEEHENDSNPEQDAVSEDIKQEPDCSTASRVLDNLRERRSITPDGLRTWLKLYDGCPETEEVGRILEQLK